MDVSHAQRRARAVFKTVCLFDEILIVGAIFGVGVRPGFLRHVTNAMAFSEFELKLHQRTVQRFVDGRRPSPELRDQVDLGFRVENQSVEIFEVRPRWRHPGETTEQGIAKATYVKKRGIWKVYWLRADLRWHRYEPDPEVESLEEFFAVVDGDEYCAFFG